MMAEEREEEIFLASCKPYRIPGITTYLLADLPTENPDTTDNERIIDDSHVNELYNSYKSAPLGTQVVVINIQLDETFEGSVDCLLVSTCFVNALIRR